MILVKSLIFIFLLLLFVVFHKTVLNFLTKLYDIREGFASEAGKAQKAGPSKAQKAEPKAPSAAGPSKAEPTTEIKYTVPETNQKEFFDSAETISNLQEKLNELMQLNEETSIINKMILKK